MNALKSMCRALWRFHRLLAAIVIVEYALAFAIVLTAAGVLIVRSTMINQTSGVDERGLYVLDGTGAGHSELANAMQRFQALVGREHVALGSSVPFFGRGALIMPINVSGQAQERSPLQVNGYAGGAQFASVLGLQIVRGRGFQKDEVAHRFGDATHVVLLSASLAKRLFHGSGAVGQQVQLAGDARTVIGVISGLAAPMYAGAEQTTYTFVLPNTSASGDLVLIRYAGPRADVYAAYAALRKHDAGRANWYLWPYSALRSAYFRTDRSAVGALAAVVVVVLVTALCGILGLTNYWIARRRPQIAIRRALGAKKRDIMLRFLAESSLLVVLGLVLGLMLNFFFSSYLGVAHFEGGVAVWVVSIALVFLIAVVVIYASLRRWLRMDPAALMRAV